jgi:hypothetical protein
VAKVLITNMVADFGFGRSTYLAGFMSMLVEKLRNIMSGDDVLCWEKL